ncbi:ribosome maturation factor RimM [Myxacorys almedinensis]|uniref:Ribosome maturation factor RimM n=1 Tax=Myxacorys almedinensis A TaxID=2690445 RepID=A0A8J7Z7V2_9CYAN|nr:ribosome maturation factor RimM [Myxacorys almedinensis]NDJ19541.1 ribosome maturation factor RimM [Myxacorys almedinensis A]
MALSDFLEIGKIVAAQGLHGEVRVYPNSDFPERFEVPGQRWLLRPQQIDPEPIGLVQGRYLEGKGLYVVQLEGVSDRRSAEALRGCLLYVLASDRLELEDGEFHVADLVGLPVYHQITQELVGTVTNVMSAGHDVLEVKSPPGKVMLIPFVEAIVPVVDLSNRRIEITPPGGLIE